MDGKVTKKREKCQKKLFFFLQIFHQHIPDGDDVAEAAGKDKEMEDGVHVTLPVEGIEGGTGDIGDTLGDEPYHGGSGDRVEERFEGDEDAQSHADETERLDVRVLLEFDEADDGAGKGTGPYEDEKAPSPVDG